MPTDKVDYFLFYDSDCGLCHRAVQWLAPRITKGLICFSPINGTQAKALNLAAVWERQQGSGLLPDSILVYDTSRCQLLARSAALVALKSHLKPLPRWALTLLGGLPTWLADWGYDWIARRRLAVFGRAQVVCPILPPSAYYRLIP